MTISAVALLAWSGCALTQVFSGAFPGRLTLSAQQRLVLLLIPIALFTTHAGTQSDNDMSRMATIQALVESRSFVIDHSSFADNNNDKVYIDGHFYSDKPPMPAILGAAVYLPLHAVGIKLHKGPSLAYYLVTLLTVKLFWIIGTIVFFRSLKFTGLDTEKCFLAALGLGFGSLFFTWSSTFNNHEFAAAFLSVGLFFLLKGRHEAKFGRNLAVAGFFLSLAGTADMPTGVFYCLFFLYVLTDPRQRRSALFYVAPLAVTLLPALAVNYGIHGSIVPVQMVPSYFMYPGSVWRDPALNYQKLSGTGLNDLFFAAKYGVRALVGAQGFLLYNPLLLVALWGLCRELRPDRPFFREALVVGSGTLALAAYYFLTTNNYGGYTYSIRWFVPLLPLLLFFMHGYFDSHYDAHPNVYRVLLCISIVIAIVGLIDPWSHIRNHGGFISNILEAAT